jgi:putative sterol carrier protein
VMKRRGTRFFLTTAIMVATFGLGMLKAASNEPDNTTPQQVFDGMCENFRAEKAKGVHARYQWALSGPTGGEWWIEVNDGTYKIGRGKIDNPNVTFIASDKTWVALSNRKLKGTWAFLTGRLKVHGDQGVARKLDEIFP